MPPHDPIICMQRLRAVVRQRLHVSHWFDGEQDPEKLLAWVCYFIAKAATDPDGLGLLTEELSASDVQVQQRQTAPLSQFSRADRLECFQGCLAFVVDSFADEIDILNDHLRPEEQPPVPHVPPWLMDVFVRWPRTNAN